MSNSKIELEVKMKSLAMAITLTLLVSTAAFGQFQNSSSQQTQQESKQRLRFEAKETFRQVTKTAKHQYHAKTCAAPNPNNGPRETFVYQNSIGKFKIPSMNAFNSGWARYRWLDNSNHDDQLTYLSHGYVTEVGGNVIPAGTKVSVWVFRAQDAKGNHFFIYFGTDPIIQIPQGKRYALYYSWDAPGPKAVIQRWLTHSGTTRD